MHEHEVRIVELEPLRAAVFQAFGAGPERAAGAELIAQAGPLGWLEEGNGRRIFGFNNPDPSPGSPNYGYEFWITLKEADQPPQEIRTREYPGGLYAVTRCRVQGDPEHSIPEAWQRLAVWCEENPYRRSGHQWLEEHLGRFDQSAEMTLDLFLPVSR